MRQLPGKPTRASAAGRGPAPQQDPKVNHHLDAFGPTIGTWNYIVGNVALRGKAPLPCIFVGNRILFVLRQGNDLLDRLLSQWAPPPPIRLREILAVSDA
jgi:hypothetical protein